MFTGIIEATGVVEEVEVNGSNKTFWISSPISSSLKPDQSVAHSGVCLTVENTRGSAHQVTAIHETLSKTTITQWQKGDIINLERCVQMNGRLDGHIVQGHVDTVAECLEKSELDGSWKFTFKFPERFSRFIIEKGSISVNGISLTLFDIQADVFSVGIVPFTYHHTNIARVTPGSLVNLEFDVVGKYVNRILNNEI